MARRARSRAGWWNRRKRSAPAPELVPAGFSSGRPQRETPKLEPRSAVERRFLHDVTRAQVRGESQSIPDVMRSDWDRAKLNEALWLAKRREAKPVNIQLLRAHQELSVRPSFANAVRVIGARDKQAEAAKAQRAARLERELSREQSSDPYPAQPPSSFPETSGVDESPFMAKMRSRANELAKMGSIPGMGHEHGMERDKDPDNRG